MPYVSSQQRFSKILIQVKVFLLVQNKHSVHVSVGFARTASLNSNLKKTPITVETLLKEAGYSFSRL